MIDAEGHSKYLIKPQISDCPECARLREQLAAAEELAAGAMQQRDQLAISLATARRNALLEAAKEAARNHVGLRGELQRSPFLTQKELTDMAAEVKP